MHLVSWLLLPWLGSAFVPDPFVARRPTFNWRAYSSSSTTADDNSALLALEAAVACGFHAAEIPFLKSLVREACQDVNLSSSPLFLSSSKENFQVQPPVDLSQVHGLTGRILVLHTPGQSADEGDWQDLLRDSIQARVDEDLYSKSPELANPFLLHFSNREHVFDEAKPLAVVIEKVVADSELVVPLPYSGNRTWDGDVSFLPSEVVEVDGALVQEPKGEDPVWDTSGVYIFDGLVSEDLRRRLAQVVAGGKDLVEGKGPDLERWDRGGLVDRFNDEPALPSYGLTPEAIQELCYEHHDALQDMECIISELFRDFIVARLPAAVFGESISPLTANAPVAGDVFDYHIDGDPHFTPPSPWTDVYGRYPNRSQGKPRFVSLLIYLNEEWRAEEWGAPTRFLDVATDTEHSIAPRPGRIVVMDQDITHSVTAPTKAAGKDRPRYSLVWKLFLHPRQDGQDMRDLSCGRSWPSPLLLGSANRDLSV
jgi:hypothetical protein